MARFVDERIVLGYAVVQVSAPRINVDTEDFPEQGKGVLRSVERVICLTPVTGGKIQITIWPENGVSRVMIPKGLRYFEENAFMLRIDLTGVPLAYSSLYEPTPFWGLEGMVEVKFSVFLEFWMKHQS